MKDDKELLPFYEVEKKVLELMRLTDQTAPSSKLEIKVLPSTSKMGDKDIHSWILSIVRETSIR